MLRHLCDVNPSSPQRMPFLDATRGLAILMMLQWHFMSGVWNYGESDWDTTIWQAFSGLTAPLFLLVSGWVVAHVLESAGNSPAIRHKLTYRGLMLIALGYSLRLTLPSLFFWNLNPVMVHVDILQIIGFGMLVIVSLAWLMRYATLRVLTALLLALCCVYVNRDSFEISFWMNLLDLRIRESAIPMNVTPQLDYEIDLPILEYWLNPRSGSVFTLFPWLAYMLAGSVAPRLVSFLNTQSKSVGSRVRIMQVIVLIAMVLFAFFVYQIDQVVAHKLLRSLGLIAAVAGVTRIVRMRWLERFGKRSLAAYVFHIVLLYGAYTGFGLIDFLPTLEFTTALLACALFTGITACIAVSPAAQLSWWSKQVNKSLPFLAR